MEKIGLYKLVDSTGKTYTLNDMTMADPASGWFEIVEVPNKGAETTSLLLDLIWLSRYPRPMQCIFDNGSEFLGKEFQELLESFGITPVPTTVRNPSANFVERTHQTLGNFIRTMDLEKSTFDKKRPVVGPFSKCCLGDSLHSAYRFRCNSRTKRVRSRYVVRFILSGKLE